MTLTPVSPNIENKSMKPLKENKKVAFGNGFNPIIPVMDGIGRGGYIAEFMAQDCFGFIMPRVGTGLYRNREETHEYNWKFAAMEAIREFLSGPSMLIIPAIILAFTKKYFGKANEVPIKFISSLGDNFQKFMSAQNGGKLPNEKALKKQYYLETMKNVLNNASEGKLKGEELEKEAKYFTNKILKIEKSPKKRFLAKLTGKKVPGTAEDLTSDLMDKFVTIRKKYDGSLGEVLTSSIKSKNKEGKTTFTSIRFDKLLKHLRNYTEDAVHTVTKEKPKKNVTEFIRNFNLKRVSSRFALILLMDLAAITFLAFVPKLYKQKGGNPGLAGLKVDEINNSENNTSKIKKEGK